MSDAKTMTDQRRHNCDGYCDHDNLGGCVNALLADWQILSTEVHRLRAELTLAHEKMKTLRAELKVSELEAEAEYDRGSEDARVLWARPGR